MTITTIRMPLIVDTKAAFTKAAFTKINGKLTYANTTRLKTENIRNAATIKCQVPVSCKEICGAIKQAHNYMLWVGRPFPNCPYLGDTPKFLDWCSVIEQKRYRHIMIWICACISSSSAWKSSWNPWSNKPLTQYNLQRYTQPRMILKNKNVSIFLLSCIRHKDI